MGTYAISKISLTTPRSLRFSTTMDGIGQLRKPE